jgi:hypothetical protein
MRLLLDLPDEKLQIIESILSVEMREKFRNLRENQNGDNISPYNGMMMDGYNDE